MFNLLLVQVRVLSEARNKLHMSAAVLLEPVGLWKVVIK